VDSDDDDFIEVASKEGFEPTIPEHRREEYGLASTSAGTSAGMSWFQKDLQSDAEDPTSLVASVLKRQQLERQKTAASGLAYIRCHRNVCVSSSAKHTHDDI